MAKRKKCTDEMVGEDDDMLADYVCEACDVKTNMDIWFEGDHTGCLTEIPGMTTQAIGLLKAKNITNTKQLFGLHLCLTPPQPSSCKGDGGEEDTKEDEKEHQLMKERDFFNFLKDYVGITEGNNTLSTIVRAIGQYPGIFHLTDNPGIFHLTDKLDSKIDAILEECKCAISLELPVEPVHAMDGKVYERSEIEKYFKVRGLHRPLTSPVTGERIGVRLLPAPHISNVIEKVIAVHPSQNGLAGAWLQTTKKRGDDKKDVDILKSKAESGDANAMFNLGGLYRFGLKGLCMDQVQAAGWYKKSSGAYYAPGTAAYGECLMIGRGVLKDTTVGIYMLLKAATEGSCNACYYLGWYHLNGKFGLPKDTNLTRDYWEKVTKGDCKYSWDLDGSYIEAVKKWLSDSNDEKNNRDDKKDGEKGLDRQND